MITDATAVKLRSEDGRFIKDVDISMFINDLPNKKDTRCFSTLDASGSTSQAAGIAESMEAGSHLFLLDEDTSATNFITFEYGGAEKEKISYAFTFEDEPTVIEITKTSLTDGKELEGAKLQVTDESGNVNYISVFYASYIFSNILPYNAQIDFIIVCHEISAA